MVHLGFLPGESKACPCLEPVPCARACQMDSLQVQCRREPWLEPLARRFDLSLGVLCGVQQRQDRLGVQFRKGHDGQLQEAPSARGDPVQG